MSRESVKPCKNCGNSALELKTITFGDKHVAEIICLNPECGERVSTYYCNSMCGAMKKAIKLWNARTASGWIVSIKC